MKSLRERFEAWLAPRLAPLRARYEALQPREQLIVAAGALVVALTLLYLVVWEPFALARDHQARALQTARSIAQQLEQDAAKRQGSGPGGGSAANSGASLLAVVDQASKDGTLSKMPSRMQPDGDKQVRIWFEDVQFDALLRWMYQLQTRYGVHIDNVAIERRNTAGLVNARLALTR